MYVWPKTIAACIMDRKKTSIGVISQYAAQVTDLQERIGAFQNKFRHMEEEKKRVFSF